MHLHLVHRGYDIRFRQQDIQVLDGEVRNTDRTAFFCAVVSRGKYPERNRCSKRGEPVSNNFSISSHVSTKVGLWSGGKTLPSASNPSTHSRSAGSHNEPNTTKQPHRKAILLEASASSKGRCNRCSALSAKCQSLPELRRGKAFSVARQFQSEAHEGRLKAANVLELSGHKDLFARDA